MERILRSTFGKALKKTLKKTADTRRKIGIIFFSSLIAVILLTEPPVFAASQGKLGNSSSGSFTINFVVYPSLDTRVQLSESEGSNGSQSGVLTDILSFDQPASLCVTGRGLAHFSLAATVMRGVNLIVSEPQGSRLTINGQPTGPLGVEQDCEASSRTLTAQSLDGFSGSSEAAVLVIHAE
ncbi:MAG: hypothetical protein ACPG5T_01030 [Endozoicomonas sp.]